MQTSTDRNLKLTPGMIVRRGHYLYFAKNWLLTVLLDLRIAGRRLDAVMFNDNPDNYPVQSISYPYLRLLPNHLRLRPTDTCVDIGCGFGRLIGYLSLNTDAKRFIGIELNPFAASIAKEVEKRCDSVEIVQGDAVALLPAEATVLLLFNPFGAEVLDAFLTCAENRCEPGTRLFYLHPEHRSVFDDHSGSWTLLNESIVQPKHMGGIVLLEYELTTDGQTEARQS